MALMMMALLAPPTSASTIGLDTNITISMDKNTGFVNTNQSSVAVSGNDMYTTANLGVSDTESFSPSATVGTSPSVNDTYGVSLQKLSGSVSNNALSGSLVAKGPYGSPSNPGIITETVTDTAKYVVTFDGKGAVNVTIPWNFTYSLINDSLGPTYFYKATYNMTINLTIGSNTYNFINPQIPVTLDSGSPYVAYTPNIPPTTLSGTWSFSTGKYHPSGTQDVTVVLNEAVTGYSAPIPPSAFLFGSGLLGLGLLGWRKKRA